MNIRSFVMVKNLFTFLLVIVILSSGGSFVSAQATTSPSINAEEICSSYKKSVGVVTFIDNRISQARISQEKIPVILEERDGVIVPVLDIPDVPLSRERVIKAGDTVPFVSVVKNKSSLFLENTSLVFFVYKIEKDQEFLIDRFVPVENISLKSGEFKEFPFSWTVPVHFKKGEYMFRPYAVSANTFALHGASFEKEASVGNIRFSVEGDASVQKLFSIDMGQGINSLSNTVFFPRTGAVPLTITLKGDPGTTFKVPLSIKVYSGMGTAVSDVVHTEEKIVEVSSEGKASFDYVFSHDDLSRYYMTVETKSGDVDSFGNIVIVRQDQGEVAVSFAGMDKNASETVSSAIPYVICLNSFGQKISPETSVVASLVNSKGAILESQEFTGTDLKNVLGGSFGAKHDTDHVSFIVEIKKNEKTMQRVEVTSPCSGCVQGETGTRGRLLIAIVLFLFSLSIIVGMYGRKRSLVQTASVFKNEK